MMLAELLSAVGDDLSYTQDRIAAESTLATATQRVSAVRHARLVDYDVRPGHLGASTRAARREVRQPAHRDHRRGTAARRQHAAVRARRRARRHRDRRGCASTRCASTRGGTASTTASPRPPPRMVPYLWDDSQDVPAGRRHRDVDQRRTASRCRSATRSWAPPAWRSSSTPPHRPRPTSRCARSCTSPARSRRPTRSTGSRSPTCAGTRSEALTAEHAPGPDGAGRQPRRRRARGARYTETFVIDPDPSAPTRRWPPSCAAGPMPAAAIRRRCTCTRSPQGGWRGCRTTSPTTRRSRPRSSSCSARPRRRRRARAVAVARSLLDADLFEDGYTVDPVQLPRHPRAAASAGCRGGSTTATTATRSASAPGSSASGPRPARRSTSPTGSPRGGRQRRRPSRSPQCRRRSATSSSRPPTRSPRPAAPDEETLDHVRASAPYAFRATPVPSRARRGLHDGRRGARLGARRRHRDALDRQLADRLHHRPAERRSRRRPSTSTSS